MQNYPDSDTVISHTRRWLERVVIGLNLCPFARKPFEAGKVRFVASTANSPELLLAELQQELAFLRTADASAVETTLLIHPQVLGDFLDYNDFLDVVDALLEDDDYEGEIQVASFHPDYQFAGTSVDDAENYSNRSPYPTLHLLREASVDHAIDNYPSPEKIPERNIHALEEAGADHMRELLAGCLQNKA